MSDYDTRNPVPSIDPRDLDDNATIFDRLLNAEVASVRDRLGVPRKTWWQMERDADALVSPNVSALAGLAGQADRVPYFTGAGALSLAVFAAVGRTLLAATTQAAQRTALGLGSSAVLAAGAANGVATLGADGKLPVSQLPPLAINETFTVANQAAMLALTAQRGDVAIRSDLNGAFYMLTADAPATLSNWAPIQQNLGVALTALSAVTPAADKIAYFTGGATAALADFSAQARTLLAATTAAAQRAALGAAAVSDKPTWTAYTPVITAAAGTFTAATATGSYMVALGMCNFRVTLTFTTKGSGTFPLFTIPVAALAGSGYWQVQARENALNGALGYAFLNGALDKFYVSGATGTTLVTGDGASVTVNGSYPIA